MINRNLLITLGLVALFALIVMPKPLYYEQPQITGVVVNKQTDEPVAGAIVVARWVLTGGFFTTYSVGVLDIQRTITGENGEFELPGWGKKWRRWLSGSYLDHRQPTITIVKAEYEPNSFYNGYAYDIDRHDRDGRARRIITINRGGQPFRLEPLAGTIEERYHQFMDADNAAYSAVIPGPLYCGDIEIYKPALLEVDKWRYQAEKHGFSGYTTGSWLNLEQYAEPDDFDELCTGVIDWLKEQRKRRKQFYEDI